MGVRHKSLCRHYRHRRPDCLIRKCECNNIRGRKSSAVLLEHVCNASSYNFIFARTGTRYELQIGCTKANRLLTMPPALLTRADEVIE